MKRKSRIVVPFALVLLLPIPGIVAAVKANPKLATKQ